MLDDCGSTHPIIESAVAYGRMASHSLCLCTPIIAIEVSDGTLCAHVMCVAWTPHLGGTTTNLMVSIISGSFDCCLCGDMSHHRVILPFLTQDSNAHGDILETPSLHVLLGECERSSSLRKYKFH